MIGCCGDGGPLGGMIGVARWIEVFNSIAWRCGMRRMDSAGIHSCFGFEIGCFNSRRRGYTSRCPAGSYRGRRCCYRCITGLQ